MNAANHRRRRVVHGLGTMAVVSFSCLMTCSGCRPQKPSVGPDDFERSWEAAHALENRGDVEAAIAAYRALCRAQPPMARGCHDEAMLLFEAGQRDEARAAAIATIEKFPDYAGVPSLVRRLAHSYEETDELSTGAQQLERLVDRTRETDACDSVLWELSLVWRRAGNVTAEVTTLETLASAHDRWTSQVWDDAVWRLSQIFFERGETSRQEQWLNRLLDSRSKSRWVGSYTSPHEDDAWLALAKLRWAAGDSRHAFEALEELRAMPESRLRDDATVLYAQWSLEKGDLERACELVREVLDTMPDASSRKMAEHLQRQWSCDGVKVGK